jgi:hypothetical protein
MKSSMFLELKKLARKSHLVNRLLSLFVFSWAEYFKDSYLISTIVFIWFFNQVLALPNNVKKYNLKVYNKLKKAFTKKFLVIACQVCK